MRRPNRADTIKLSRCTWFLSSSVGFAPALSIVLGPVVEAGDNKPQHFFTTHNAVPALPSL